MIKVAINTRFLIPNKLEGIGRYTHEICSRMVVNNPDIEFHFLFDRAYDKKFIYGPNVNPHVIYPSARLPILWSFWFEKRIPSILNRLGIDVFFSPDNYLSLGTNVPTVMTSHDLAFEHFPHHLRKSHLRYYKRYSPLYHQAAKRIACVSEFTRKDIIEHYNIPQEKTFISYNACTNDIKPLNSDEKMEGRNEYANGEEFFIFIGAIHPRKNVERLIRAYDKFKSKTRSNTKLIIVGRLAWKTNLFEESKRVSSYSKDIIHIPFVKKINRILGSAKGLCYTSLFEGFGIPILEAFQAQVPVITSNVSSMPEVAGQAALLVNPQNDHQISSAMMKIEADEKLRNALIKKGKIQNQKFSWDESANLIMSELKSLC